MANHYLNSILHIVFLVAVVLLNVCSVESRRRRRSYDEHRQSAAAHTRGADPLPWWAITFIFVGGVLGVFLCVVGLKKVYEKKRQQKIRSMVARRSASIQRRRSQQRQGGGVTSNPDLEGALPHLEAPPTYEQSVHDSQPPVYCKEVTDETNSPASPPPQTPVASPGANAAFPTAAPPSYEMAQNDCSEVVEMGAPATQGPTNGADQ
ncbi:uncharacterized protein [Diadema antillarum]|uniref:uncharacterized protein n=1 Tax=Diadema antillarum TaxID=105358 RepID=UPI003A878F98